MERSWSAVLTRAYPADNVEHVSSSRLLLQGFAQLVQQTGILDGDDGLACEIAHQRDLLVGKRSDLLAVDGDCAVQFGLLEHRHDHHCPYAPQFNRRDRQSLAVQISLR